jgi:hypothetical protein
VRFGVLPSGSEINNTPIRRNSGGSEFRPQTASAISSREITGGPVKNVGGDRIVFDFHATHDNILSNVTVADAKWMGQILSRLSDQQISDAFRAANYSADEVSVLTKTFRARIDELANLPG